MLPFGVTIPATVPQRSEIPEGLMNYPVYIYIYINLSLSCFTSTYRSIKSVCVINVKNGINFITVVSVINKLT